MIGKICEWTTNYSNAYETEIKLNEAPTSKTYQKIAGIIYPLSYTSTFNPITNILTIKTITQLHKKVVL